MSLDELLWSALVVAAAFAVLAYYTLRFFRAFRGKMRRIEEKANTVEEQFLSASHDAAALASGGKAMLSASELEETLNAFISRAFQKAVVVRRRG